MSRLEKDLRRYLRQSRMEAFKTMTLMAKYPEFKETTIKILLAKQGKTSKRGV